MQWRKDTGFIYLRFADQHSLPYAQVLRAVDVIAGHDTIEGLVNVTPDWSMTTRVELVRVYNDEQMRRRDEQTKERVKQRLKQLEDERAAVVRDRINERDGAMLDAVWAGAIKADVAAVAGVQPCRLDGESPHAEYERRRIKAHDAQLHDDSKVLQHALGQSINESLQQPEPGMFAGSVLVDEVHLFHPMHDGVTLVDLQDETDDAIMERAAKLYGYDDAVVQADPDRPMTTWFKPMGAQEAKEKYPAYPDVVWPQMPDEPVHVKRKYIGHGMFHEGPEDLPLRDVTVLGTGSYDAPVATVERYGEKVMEALNKGQPIASAGPIPVHAVGDERKPYASGGFVPDSAAKQTSAFDNWYFGKPRKA